MNTGIGRLLVENPKIHEGTGFEFEEDIETGWKRDRYGNLYEPVIWSKKTETTFNAGFGYFLKMINVVRGNPLMNIDFLNTDEAHVFVPAGTLMMPSKTPA